MRVTGYVDVPMKPRKGINNNKRPFSNHPGEYCLIACTWTGPRWSKHAEERLQ